MPTTKALSRLVVLSLALLPVAGNAFVVQMPCVDCHTMHNSQGGLAVVQNMVDGSGTMEVSSVPNEALLNTNCIGCHEGNNSVGGRAIPYVLQTSGVPTYNNTGTENDTTTLAGGNFYWVAAGQEKKGHNVSGIADADSRFGNTPPGGSDLGSQLTCAGTTGCHGDRSVSSGQIAAMYKSHHRNDMTLWKDGSTLAKSYRFLNGIEGFEDTQYEYQPSETQHNRYYGIDRSVETDTATGTISSLCAQCHGDFHNGAGEVASGTFGSGVWLRHPTDFDMSRASTSSEYDEYNGGSGTGNTYSVISPVSNATKTAAVNTTIYSASDDAIVMCLSCHRPHGTPNEAILRWDYKSWPASGYNGCAVCHTTKD